MVKQRGLTLLEMLISLVILSSVMMLASTSYSHYVTGFNTRGSKINDQLQEFKRSTLWQRQLSSSFYYLLKGSDNIEYKPWFFGEKNQVSWFASTSLTEPGMASAAWLGMIDSEMVYCEQPLTEHFVVSLTASPESICNNYQQAISPASALSFEYYGWKNVYDRYETQSEFIENQVLAQPQWFDEYSGVVNGLIPLWIKITITPPSGANDESSFDYWVQIQDNDSNKLDYFFGASSG